MPPDDTISTTTPIALPTAARTENVRAASPNDAVIEAIHAHHAQLAKQLRVCTDAVANAARAGECGRERDALHEWYRAELMPHVVAEEQVLYGPASELDATQLLVCGMLGEHRLLVSLIAELALASDPFQVASTAVAVQTVFRLHLAKENDLLLPALDQAGLDLPAILNGMHEILSHSRDGVEVAAEHEAVEHDGCGCGCGCDNGTGKAQHVSLQVSVDAGEADGDLDVQALPHGQRHDIIFARLDKLQPGQSLVIVNDHDPKPLRYQTAAMWPDRFEWTYRQAGPEVWRVAISRVD